MHHTAPPDPAALRKRRPPAGAVPCAALRRYMLHRVMRCNALPRSGGQVSRQAAKYPAMRSGHESPDRRIVSAGFPFLPASRHHASGPPMYAAPCSGAVAPHIERGRGAAIAPVPPGLITLAAGPESAAAAPSSLWPRAANKCSSAVKARSRGEP
jgi:hypothetical protein